MPPEILSADSEAYVLVGPLDTTRVYTNTSLGDVYINEVKGATLGVIGGSMSDISNMSVAGYGAYRATVRYERGQMATLVLISTERGATLVEVGKDIRDTGLDEFLLSLVTQTEN